MSITQYIHEFYFIIRTKIAIVTVLINSTHTLVLYYRKKSLENYLLNIKLLCVVLKEYLLKLIKVYFITISNVFALVRSINNN